MTLRSALVTVGVVALLLAVPAGAQPPWVQAPGRTADFQGYWLGIDPVDGGDARRSLVRLNDGRYSLAARDSFFSLCDDTDRGFGSFDDGVVSGNVLRSNNLTLRCFNNGAQVVLHIRFELIGPGVMTETATLADGTPVSTIVFHRVNAK